MCHLDAGEYSCLTVDLTFKREFSYYLLTIYVPCCMLVIVSWVNIILWIIISLPSHLLPGAPVTVLAHYHLTLLYVSLLSSPSLEMRPLSSIIKGLYYLYYSGRLDYGPKNAPSLLRMLCHLK